MPLNYYCRIIIFHLSCQSEESFSVEYLKESHSISASSKQSRQFASGVNCSPTTLDAQDSISYAFLKELHAEGHFKLKDIEPFHCFEAELD